MRRVTVLLVAVSLMLAFAAPVTSASSHDLDVTVTAAPVAPDGTTAGAQTDFVVTFADRDPGAKGFFLEGGGTVEIQLPEGFVNVEELPNGDPAPVTQLPSPPDCVPGNLKCSTAVLLRGWPQSAVFPGIAYDENTNTITLTLADAAPEPGVKQAHLILLGFRNPHPGAYRIGVTVTEDGTTYSGEGVVHIIPKTRPSINGVSVKSNTPDPGFANLGVADGRTGLIYQTVEPDEAAPLVFYLWERGGAPIGDVELNMINAKKGRILLGNKTVGQVEIDAPKGASEYELSVESLETVPSFAIGVPTTEWFLEFVAEEEGDYALTFSMNGGNSQQHFITVDD